MNNTNTQRALFISLLIVFAAASRLLPHPMNVAPIAAMALFGSSMMNNKTLGFIIPLSAMLISDLKFGYHDTIWAVYLSFALIGGIGLLIRNRTTLMNVVAASVGSSVLFFLITNYAVQIAYPGMYNNMLENYIAALPFFRNSLLGDLFYSTVLFGGFYLAQLKFPQLAKVKG